MFVPLQTDSFVQTLVTWHLGGAKYYMILQIDSIISRLGPKPAKEQ